MAKPRIFPNGIEIHGDNTSAFELKDSAGVSVFLFDTTNRFLNIKQKGINTLLMNFVKYNTDAVSWRPIITNDANNLAWAYTGNLATAVSFTQTGGIVATGTITATNYREVGTRNILIGSDAGNLTMTGSDNIFSGNEAGYSNTTGFRNIFIGTQSGYSNTDGFNNIFSGTQSGYSNTTGNNNIFSGANSGVYLADGSTSRTTGDYGLYLGADTKASANGTTNEIVIGYNAIGTGSNTVVLGSDAVTKTTLKGNVETNGSIKFGNDTATASAEKAGAIRYRVDGTKSYVEICVQNGASSYTWKIINEEDWT